MMLASTILDQSIFGYVIGVKTVGFNTGADGQTLLTAGQDLNLGTIKESHNNRVTASVGWFRDERSNEVGSNILTTGDLSMIAERDINARAANVSSEQGSITAVAGQNLTIEAGEAEQHQQKFRESSSSGFLSSKSTTVFDTLDKSTVIASTFSGEQVNLQSGSDLNVAGSNVIATGDVNLNAGSDINITPAESTHNETHFREEKRSGLFSSSGGFGVTWGKQEKSDDVDQRTTHQVSSTIGSLEGDINLNAGKDATITASDLLARQGSINVSGENVTIDSADDIYDLKEEHKFKQSGITLALSGGIIDTIQTIRTSAERIDSAKDKRLKALHAWRLNRVAGDISDGFDNLDHLGSDFSDPMTYKEPTDKQGNAQSSGINLSISLGSSSSEQTITQHDETALGSSLLADNEINITARGSNSNNPVDSECGEEGCEPESEPTGGDITLEGALLEAKNINLNANDEIKLTSAENTSDREEDSESSSAGIGISIGSDGFLFFVEGSVARGEINQSSDRYLETIVNASDRVSMISGGDTTLKGAQVMAPRVEVTSGGDLNIISEQDEEHYENDQKSIGGRVGIGYGRWSVSLNASQLEADSDYVAVQEQSGIFAGEEGYSIDVANNTHLQGGAIVSSATPDKNRLNTDTLSHNSIHNEAEYEVDSKSISFSTSSSGPSSPTKGFGGGFSNDSGEAENTTYSAISKGEVTVRSNPEQSLTGLKRSKEEAHQVLERIFTEDKIQQAQETVELTQLFAEEAYMEIGRIYEEVDSLKKHIRENKDKLSPLALAALQQALAEKEQSMVVSKEVAHAIAGGITAVLGGGNFMQGAAAAGLSEFAAQKLTNQLPKNDTLRNIALTMLGGAIGGTSGGIIAGSADQFNRQLHGLEIMLITLTAEAYAQKRGISYDEAVTELKQQGQLQTGDEYAGFNENADARAWLDTMQVGLLDSGSGLYDVVLFDATDEQKAATHMFASTLDSHSNFYVGDYGSYRYENALNHHTITDFIGQNRDHGLEMVARTELAEEAYRDNNYGENDFVFGRIEGIFDKKFVPIDADDNHYYGSPSFNGRDGVVDPLDMEQLKNGQVSGDIGALAEYLGLSAIRVGESEDSWGINGQQEKLLTGVDYLTGGEGITALLLNDGYKTKAGMQDVVRRSLGNRLTDAERTAISDAVAAVREGEVLNLSSDLAKATARTLQANGNWLTLFKQYLDERTDETTAINDFLAHVNFFSVALAEEIGRSFETMVDKDAPEYMRSKATVAVATEVMLLVAEEVRLLKYAKGGGKVHPDLNIGMNNPNYNPDLNKRIFGNTGKVYGLGDLSNIAVYGLKAQRIIYGNNGKVAVIGRSMGNQELKGVRDYAEHLKQQGYNVELFDGDMIPRSARKEFEKLTEGGRRLTNSELVKTEMYQVNKAWAQKLRSEEYTIIDIGNPHNQGFSPFYTVEKLSIFEGK